MAEHDLSDRYRDLREVDRRGDGVWYSAALPDGTAARVVVLSPELIRAVRHPERVLETLERAAHLGHAVLDRPLAWGRLEGGALHAAFGDTGSAPMPTGMSAAEVAEAGETIARALSGLHETGLAHGAITRERVRRRADGSVELRDVGLLAALVSGGVDPRSAALSLSEPHYASPEVQNGAVPDERSDIFSLGAVLYELLTGKPPYGGRTTAYVMASVLAGEEQAKDTIETTNPVVDALVRAIEREPDDRWPSATALADALATGTTRRSGSGGSRRTGKGGGCLPGAAIMAALVIATMTALR
jgi:hypothetical protein